MATMAGWGEVLLRSAVGACAARRVSVAKSGGPDTAPEEGVCLPPGIPAGRHKSVTVRPVLDQALDYGHADRRDCGAAWMEHGVEVETGLFTAAELRFSADSGKKAVYCLRAEKA